ncbi:MAG: hypothetical protein ABI594_11340 [Ginsengibacter sp.]
MKIETLNIEFGDIRFQFISGLVKIFEPKELYVIRVDNWFDSKWLNFSGKVLGLLGVWKYYDETTIPPFNPNRITGEGVLDRIQTDENLITYRLRQYDNFIHISQPSERNQNRKIKQFSNDAIFGWYSDNTTANNFGCIMIYILKDGELNKFYVSFENKPENCNTENWNINKIVGINSNEIHRYLEIGTTFPINAT